MNTAKKSISQLIAIAETNPSYELAEGLIREVARLRRKVKTATVTQEIGTVEQGATITGMKIGRLG